MFRNPFVARGMIKSDSRFWGRENELRTIYSLLWDSEEEPQSVAIVGLRRIGKSSLLYRVTQKRGTSPMYSSQECKTICVMLSMQAMSNFTTQQFFTRVLTELSEKSEVVRGLLVSLRKDSEEDASEVLNQLLRLMEKRDLLLVLVLDEFECAAENSDFDKNFFDLLRSLAQQWRVSYIVGTQTDLDKLWDKSLISSPLSSPFFNFFQTITLAGFMNSETSTYLTSASKAGGVEFNADQVQFVQGFGGSHPFFVNVAAYHVFQLLSHDENRLSTDLNTLWNHVIQDPTVYGNFSYYYHNLNGIQRGALLQAASGFLSRPLDPRTAVDVNWLLRMGLLRPVLPAGFSPFSRSFSDYLLLHSMEEYGHTTPGVSEAETLQSLIARNESASLEFKASLRWDIHQNKPNPDVEFGVLKTLAAFLNTDGGTLMIGVSDDNRIVGLQNDYNTFRKKNRDGFELHLTKLVSEKIGKPFCRYVRPSFHSIDDQDICKVDVNACPDPAYLGNEEAFFIRTLNSTQQLNPREVHEYITRHWATSAG